ncbi:MAG: hypothetical protein IKH74_04595, partial [Lachnospiraceae bacterium]|nr:hypothetical protein [Lachnospiraceae bacterium]
MPAIRQIMIMIVRMRDGMDISYAVLDKLMSLSGLAMQTGVGVAKKINMLAHCIVRGIAQGALPLIGYNFAAGNRKR